MFQFFPRFGPINEDGACEVLFFYQNKNRKEVMMSFLIDMYVGKALAYRNCMSLFTKEKKKTTR